MTVFQVFYTVECCVFIGMEFVSIALLYYELVCLHSSLLDICTPP